MFLSLRCACFGSIVRFQRFVGNWRGIVPIWNHPLSFSLSLLAKWFSLYDNWMKAFARLFSSGNFERPNSVFFWIWQLIFNGSPLIFQSKWNFQLKYSPCECVSSRIIFEFHVSRLSYVYWMCATACVYNIE